MKIGITAPLSEVDAALLELLRRLERRGYAFITPTPATHARILARAGQSTARTVEDVLGWSLPFEPGIMPPDLLACLEAANMIVSSAGVERSRVRVSSLDGNLYLHSAYPTVTQDAVFFGPDSYRFANLIMRELALNPPAVGAHIIDIGTGAGVGAIVAATTSPGRLVTMTDINAQALRLARVNAIAAGVTIAAVETAGLEKVEGEIDVAMINPPYIIDGGDARTYRDGGGLHGAGLSLELTKAALDRLHPGGRVILYTGSAIVGGRDALRTELEQSTAAGRYQMQYNELDPDVFGEELEKPAYRDVDRIALVAAIIRRPEQSA